MKKSVIALVLSLVLLLGACMCTAYADGTTETLTVTVTYGQTEARSMLDLINDFRAKVPTTEWDSDEPWAPDAADVYEGWLQSNNECKMSPALGFSFDAANVADEISACAGVVDQYQNSLLLGIGDTDALYAEFLAALERAGVNEIIADKQAQLDAWKAK